MGIIQEPLEGPKDLVFFDNTFDKLIAKCVDEKMEKYNYIQTGHLPNIPTKNDLRKVSKIRLRKKRSKSKFDKYWYRYVSDEIYAEYMAKVLVAPILRPLNYQEIGRKLLSVEPLPSPAGLIHYMNIKCRGE